jgi:signal transduction histidine kinase
MGGDVAIAAITAAFCITGAVLVGATADEPNFTLLGAVVLVAQCAPLVYRRRFPLTVWLLVGIAASIYGMVDWPDPLIPLGAFVALASVVECCPRRTALVAWLVTALVGGSSAFLAGDSDIVDAWVLVVILVFAPLAGDHQRNRSAYLAELQASATRATQEREREVRDAQLAERAHLAREMHDIVAHHVSMIVVQAEAGATRASRGTDDAVDAFDAIASTGRRTLGELRTLLDVLKTEGTTRAPTAPQPGLNQIGELVRDLSKAGLEVDLSVGGDRRPLPLAIDMSVYRIVQEGLTNVVKHASARHATVGICFEGRHLGISIVDDGVGPVMTGALNGRGHGLDGLRERVSLLHGELDAGRDDAGGFRLDVTLPVEA